MNNDLISRSALKEEFAKHEDRKGYLIGDWEEFIDNAPTVEYTFEEAFQKTVCEHRLYCPERPQGKWIPVSERLPDLFEVVLVTDETNNVFEYERLPLDEEGNVCEKWTFLGRKIIAWMLLPEPYKEADHDKAGY